MNTYRMTDLDSGNSIYVTAVDMDSAYTIARGTGVYYTMAQRIE